MIFVKSVLTKQPVAFFITLNSYPFHWQSIIFVIHVKIDENGKFRYTNLNFALWVS